MDGGRGVSEFLKILAVCLVAQSCLTLCSPMDCHATGSSVHGDPLGKNTGVFLEAAMPSSKGSSQPRDLTQVCHTAGDSSPAEPPGKPKNTAVGSLSLLQQIYPTQESNQGLLHYDQIQELKAKVKFLNEIFKALVMKITQNITRQMR